MSRRDTSDAVIPKGQDGVMAVSARPNYLEAETNVKLVSASIVFSG